MIWKRFAKRIQCFKAQLNLFVEKKIIYSINFNLSSKKYMHSRKLINGILWCIPILTLLSIRSSPVAIAFIISLSPTEELLVEHIVRFNYLSKSNSPGCQYQKTLHESKCFSAICHLSVMIYSDQRSYCLKAETDTETCSNDVWMPRGKGGMR